MSSDEKPQARRRTRYTLGDAIGEGGMAIVYTATDEQLDRTVAVKCLRQEMAERGELKQRFFDEARILGGLEHPGAIPIYEAGKLPDGRLFYSMKKIEGRTLTELLAARDSRKVRDPHQLLRFIDLFSRVCETMAAAHAERVIHRDLKPDNIMIDATGAVYVMDWGLAKQLDDTQGDTEASQTLHGAVLGTPAYMSPEQAAGRTSCSDCQSDVFSLGVIFYEILTGKCPFEGLSASHSMKGVMHHDPPHPRSLNPRAGRALSAVCMKALDKDPFRRYASARELAEDIRCFRQHLPVTAIRIRWHERLRNGCRRRPALAASVGTLAAIGLLAAFGLGLLGIVRGHVLEAAYQRFELAEGGIQDLQELLRQVEKRLGDPSVETSQREVLVARGRLLESMIDLERGALLGAVWAVDEIFDDGGRSEEIVRQGFLDFIEEARAQQDWPQVYVLLDYALSRQRTGLEQIFDEQGIARLDAQRKQALEQIDRAGLSEALAGVRLIGWAADE